MAVRRYTQHSKSNLVSSRCHVISSIYQTEKNIKQLQLVLKIVHIQSMKKGKALLRKCIYVDNGKGKKLFKKFSYCMQSLILLNVILSISITRYFFSNLLLFITRSKETFLAYQCSTSCTNYSCTIGLFVTIFKRFPKIKVPGFK